MSQRPPRKKRSPKKPTSNQRRTREPTAASPKTKAFRSSERRLARKEAAQQKEKQQKQLRILGGVVAVGVIIALVLIMVNRPGEDAADVDYSGIAMAQPLVTRTVATPAATTDETSAEPYTGAVLGDPNAPVTMVVYSDFQCPFCRSFNDDIQPQVIEDFVRSGDVKIEFREFAALGGEDLTDDSNESAQSAEAVLCASEQDQYLEYHEKLFANQAGENSEAYSNDRLKQFASEIGLDTGAFNQCLDSGRYESTISRSKSEGQALGITATPMFVINGNVLQMTQQGYDLLEKQLETAVQQAQ